ncbi:MAG: sulfite exporter TauE/SafE family protein [Acidobacteria bacterium]|nr:sulfite exporter TauE/SafE family protein [Acidobacteriota bacterium]
MERMQFPVPPVVTAAAAAFLAGAINSVAGGGTLVSFPTLVWLGLPSITANATSTVAIWPGSLGSIWGFRNEFRQTSRRMRWLAVSSLVGGGIGAWLLRSTPASLFDHLVPFLILFATVLFTVQAPIQKRLGARGAGGHDVWMPGAFALNLLVAIYGGYFGAGMSIMMLSSLAILGMTDILQMNALTSLFALCVNGVAAVLFITTHMVDWRYVAPMAIAAVLGGYGAAGVARKIGRVAVRRFVIVVGYSMSVLLFLRHI